jgi:hypothetical protein
MRTSTIIPTFPPHFGFTVDLLNSYNKFSNNDIYLIFTNQHEYELFKPITNIPYNYLITNDEVISKYPNNTINIKKFFGLDNIIHQYDYVGIFDSETLFIREFDSDIIYPTIFSKKILKSNMTSCDSLIKKSAEMMGLVDNQKLKDQTENYTYYWWFNEICVYEQKTYFEFKKYLNSLPNVDQILNERDCFDYILYGIWLICFTDFNIKKYLTHKLFPYGALEHNSDDMISKEFASYMDHNQNYNSSDTIKAIIQLDFKGF